MNDPIFDDPTVHQRAIDSILAGENELRRIAEATSHSLREILMDIAYRWDGRRLEDLRQKDPHAPGNWSPAEWKQFFQSFHPEQPGWPAPRENHNDLLEKLSDENYELRKKIAEQKLLLEEVSRKAQGEDEPDQPRNKTDGSNRKQKVVVPSDYEDIIEPLRNLQLPSKPLRFKGIFAETESLYRRQIMLMYLIATKGVSIRVEMDLVMAAVEGISPRSSVVRKIVEKLVKGGLLESRIYTLERPLRTSLQLVWLSEMGKDLCNGFGWSVVESDWEKLKKLFGSKESEEKAISMMLIALHARVRGYRVKLRPDNDSEVSSDLLLTSGDDIEIHTFLLMGSSIPHETFAQMTKIDGKVGICGRDREQRCIITEIVQRAGIQCGVSTDLFSLITNDKKDQQPIPIAEIGKDNTMWMGEW